MMIRTSPSLDDSAAVNNHSSSTIPVMRIVITNADEVEKQQQQQEQQHDQNGVNGRGRSRSSGSDGAGETDIPAAGQRTATDVNSRKITV